MFTQFITRPKGKTSGQLVLVHPSIGVTHSSETHVQKAQEQALSFSKEELSVVRLCLIDHRLNAKAMMLYSAIEGNKEETGQCCGCCLGRHR